MEFPDYMKERIISEIGKIILDIDYYKNKKDIIRLLTRLYDLTNNNNENLLIEILSKAIKKIENDEIEEEKLKNIEKSLFGFFKRNEKLHIKKIVIDNGVIYEYNDSYSLYIRKPSKLKQNLKEIIKERFNELKIISIYIDNHKWKKIENITEDDIKNSKLIKIDIKK